MVLHDINLSARYADHIFALQEGKLVAEGKPAEVITSTLIKDIFGLNCTVIEDRRPHFGISIGDPERAISCESSIRLL